MDVEREDKQSVEAEEDKRVEEDGSPVGGERPELDSLRVAGNGEQQSRRQQHEQKQSYQHWRPIRHPSLSDLLLSCD